MQNTYKDIFQKCKYLIKQTQEHQLLFRPHSGIGSAQGPHIFDGNVPALPQQPHGVPIDNVVQGH